MTNMHEMDGAVSRTVDNAASSAHRAINKAQDVTRPAVEHMATSAHHAVDRIGSAATHAADSLAMRGEQVRDAQLRLTESCRSQVRAQPIASIGVAVAGGFLLGWLLKQR